MAAFMDRRSSWLLMLGLVLAPACTRSGGPPPVVPEKPRAEVELARITLAHDAVQSLGIQTLPILTQRVQEHIALTGWITARPGNEVTVTAPLAGYVGAPAPSASLPLPGRKVEAGQELLTLQPVLSPLEQVQLAALHRDVRNELAKARESVAVADAELRRVTDLHQQGLRGTQDLEQAQARLKFAREDQAAAEDKLKLFAAAKEGAALPTQPIRSPRAGTLVTLLVSPGQYVPAAAPLATIIDLTPAWLRVPVPEVDLPRLDPSQAITLSPAPGIVFDARPVALVPQVDPVRHTADLFYEIAPAPRRLPNARAVEPLSASPVLWARDQMLAVQVPAGERRHELIVPYSAVLFDAYGGTWVYIDQTPPQAPERLYERRRIELGPTLGDRVVVRGHCQPGEQVVVVGAAALFSREFHFPPVKSAAGPQNVDDDDD